MVNGWKDGDKEHKEKKVTWRRARGKSKKVWKDKPRGRGCGRGSSFLGSWFSNQPPDSERKRDDQGVSDSGDDGLA